MTFHVVPSSYLGYSTEELAAIPPQQRNLRVWLAAHSPSTGFLDSSYPLIPPQHLRYDLTVVYDSSLAKESDLKVVKRLLEFAAYLPEQSDEDDDELTAEYNEDTEPDKSWLAVRTVPFDGEKGFREGFVEKSMSERKGLDSWDIGHSVEIVWDRKKKGCLVVGGDKQVKAVVDDLRVVNQYHWNAADGYRISNIGDENEHDYDDSAVRPFEEVDLLFFPTSSHSSLYNSLYPPPSSSSVKPLLHPFLSLLTFLLHASPFNSAPPGSESQPFSGTLERKTWTLLPDDLKSWAEEGEEGKVEAEEGTSEASRRLDAGLSSAQEGEEAEGKQQEKKRQFRVWV